MAEDEPHDPFQDFLARASDRGLGDIELRKHSALSSFARANEEAASNLLQKALDALDAGDDAKARRMVQRAVALPYDEGERGQPAALVAEQSMFEALVDALEEDPGQDWLDAAVATLGHASTEGRFAMRDALTAMLHDYEIPGRERRHLLRAMARVPERDELHTLDLTPEQLTAAVLEVLQGVLHFEDGYEELGILGRRGE